MTSPRRGFTLLELFLTLSMAVVLMTLISTAFSFYTRDMDSADVTMRQTMLAAAVMQMIENDLRASLHPEPLDTSALEDLLAKTAASATGGQGGEGAAGEMSASDAEAAGVAEEDTSLDDTTFEGEGIVLETPGVIGSQYQIQIDTSRLPRLEEYGVIMDTDPGNLNDLPSDLKTVSYYVQDASSIGVDDPLAEVNDTVETTASGLVRRSLDRSVTSFAAVSGNLASVSQTGELLAPEIIGIEFGYWDGTTWQIEWNSDEIGELPLAVQVTMVMGDPGSSDPSLADSLETEPRTFRHVVRLPLAKPIEEEDEDDLTGAGI